MATTDAFVRASVATDANAVSTPPKTRRRETLSGVGGVTNQAYLD